MPNINKCFLTGHAGRDAETRVTPSGKAITEINLAINNGYGENKKTVWTKIKIIGKPVEWMRDVRKGDAVSVAGAEYCTDEGERKTFHYFLCGVGCECFFVRKNESEGEKTLVKHDQNQEAKDELPF